MHDLGGGSTWRLDTNSMMKRISPKGPRRAIPSNGLEDQQISQRLFEAGLASDVTVTG